MPSLNTNRGAKRARECRADLGLDPLAPLRCLLTTVEEQVGLPVVVAPLGDRVAGAFTDVEGFRLLFVNGQQSVSRQRFTLAHELGHVRCGHDAGRHYDTFETLGRQRTKSAEVQANAFAGELLAPIEGLRDLLSDEPRLEHVVRIAAAYGTSPLSMVFSLYRAGLASSEVRDRLRAAVDAEEHWPLVEELGLQWPEDRLAEIAASGRPYLSPALDGSALAAALRGDKTVEEAAQAAGVPAGALRPAVERLTAVPASEVGDLPEAAVQRGQ